MCLLVQQPASTSFTDDFLADVYAKNKDGLGVMYAEDGKVHVFKCLPTSAQEFIDFYRKHADGKDCVWHARMQTHGDIDFDNCHPYKVTDDIWLAHNGILSMGNDSDTKRSDTWHFINFVLRPALIADPKLIHDASFQAYMGSMIGSGNKFGIVTGNGDVVLINRKSGVEFVGAWLSNTYAWSPSKFGFYQTPTYPTKTYHSNWMQGKFYGNYDDDLRYYKFEEEEKVKEAKGQLIKEEVTTNELRKYVRAAFNCWTQKGVRGVEQWVHDAPYKAIALLNHYYDEVDDITTLVDSDPVEASEWIADLFHSESVTPSWVS
jgi:hypothetical protein